MKCWILESPVKTILPSIGLLIYRIVFGGFMLVGHGVNKLMSFNTLAETFPDPLGIGNELSLVSAVFCEVVCTTLVILGLATRLAVLPLVFTMVIAAFVIHGADPFFMGSGAAKEPALIYLAAYALLLFTGAGSLSLDNLIAKRI
jgi:putative oxidoreductase